jgi:hypothetical protein
MRLELANLRLALYIEIAEEAGHSIRQGRAELNMLFRREVHPY